MPHLATWSDPAQITALIVAITGLVAAVGAIVKAFQAKTQSADNSQRLSDHSAAISTLQTNSLPPPVAAALIAAAPQAAAQAIPATVPGDALPGLVGIPPAGAAPQTGFTMPPPHTPKGMP